MSVDDRQLQSLVYLACTTQRRGYGDRRWDEAGVAGEVRKLSAEGLSAEEIIQRTLSHAWNPKSHTPAMLRYPADSPVRGEPLPQRVGVDECPVHPGKPAATCNACAADALANDTTRKPDRRLIYDEVTGEKLRHRPLRELVDEELAELVPEVEETDA